MNPRALFLDRDGTVIEEVNHLTKIEQIKLIPEMLDIMKVAQSMGYFLILITNQSVVARGWITEDELEDIHHYLVEELKTKGIIMDGIYYCPHHFGEGKGKYKIVCDCRKPKPGLILKAAEDFNVDLKNSIMVGDHLTDIEAAIEAGCRYFHFNGENYRELEKLL